MSSLNGNDSTGLKGQKVLEQILGDKYQECEPAIGDGIFIGNNSSFVYEVKTTEAQSTSNVSLNQVRAIKCIALIVYFKTLQKWAVLSPIEVLEFAIEKNRGQHNEISLECAAISTSKIPEQNYCTEEEIIYKLEETSSVFFSDEYKRVKIFCDSFLNNLQSLNDLSKKTIEAMVKS